MGAMTEEDVRAVFTPEVLSSLCEWCVEYCLEKYGNVPGFEGMDIDVDDDLEDGDGPRQPWDADLRRASTLMMKDPRSARDVNTAVAIYLRVIETIPTGTEDWGECNAAMGFAYADKDVESGEGSQEREDSLDKAISCLNQALNVLTQASHSMQFAEIHDQLGMVHLERTRGDRPENLANAIESFQKCLEVYTEASNPLERAEVQEKLSIAYQEAAGLVEEEEQAGYDSGDFMD